MDVWVKRSEWRAPGTLKGQELFVASRVRGVVAHYIDDEVTPRRRHEDCAGWLRDITREQMRRGYATLAYNYAGCQHGAIFEGRPIPYQSAANGGRGRTRAEREANTEKNNAEWVAFLFMSGAVLPTVAARHAFQRVRLQTMKVYGYDARLYVPHSKLNSTGCPGDPVRAWIADHGPEF